MITSGNLIKIDKQDIETLKRQKNMIDSMNQRMVVLRQKQIYTSLSQATKMKIELFQKVSKWMNMLEGKIFTQQVVDSMDLNRAVSLMKYVSNTALKLLAQMKDMEDVFKAYIELNGKIGEPEKPMESQGDSDLANLKKGLYEILSESVKENSVEITPKQEEPVIVPEVKLDDDKVKKDVLSNLGTEIPELDSETKKSGESEDSPLVLPD